MESGSSLVGLVDLFSTGELPLVDECLERRSSLRRNLNLVVLKRKRTSLREVYSKIGFSWQRANFNWIIQPFVWFPYCNRFGV